MNDAELNHVNEELLIELTTAFHEPSTYSLPKKDFIALYDSINQGISKLVDYVQKQVTEKDGEGCSLTDFNMDIMVCRKCDLKLLLEVYKTPHGMLFAVTDHPDSVIENSLEFQSDKFMYQFGFNQDKQLISLFKVLTVDNFN